MSGSSSAVLRRSCAWLSSSSRSLRSSTRNALSGLLSTWSYLSWDHAGWLAHHVHHLRDLLQRREDVRHDFIEVFDIEAFDKPPHEDASRIHRLHRDHLRLRRKHRVDDEHHRLVQAHVVFVADLNEDLELLDFDVTVDRLATDA